MTAAPFALLLTLRCPASVAVQLATRNSQLNQPDWPHQAGQDAMRCAKGHGRVQDRQAPGKDMMCGIGLLYRENH